MLEWGSIQVFPMLFTFKSFCPVNPFILLKGPRILKPFPYFAFLYGFSQVCMVTCLLKTVTNGFLHSLYPWGFSLSSFVFIRNCNLCSLYHTVYIRRVSPVSFLSCFRRSLGYLNALLYSLIFIGFLCSEISFKFLKIIQATECCATFFHTL